MDMYQTLKKKSSISLNDAIALLKLIYINAHRWNIGDTIGDVYANINKHIVHDLLINNINNKTIKGYLDHTIASEPEPYDYDCEESDIMQYLNYERSEVDVADLITLAAVDLGNISLVPEELLSIIGIINTNKPANSKHDKTDPVTNKELGELRLQKEKWDASIVAATKIGLLFYEHGLDKKSNKETFVKEFSQHLGDGLPDSTIEKIYKALPSGYKQSGGRPKKDTATANIDNIIKAAAFAGTLHEAPERLKLSSLKSELKELEIDLPDDDVLKKIIDTVKKLDI